MTTTRARSSRLVPAFVVVAALAASRDASAHALHPALLMIDEGAAGQLRVLWKLNALEGASELVPEIAGCPDTSARSSSQVGGAVIREWTARCDGSVAGKTISIRGLSSGRTDALVRVALEDGRAATTVLRQDSPTFVVPTRPSSGAVARTYAKLGIEHVLSGTDHLALVLGLLLLVSTRWRLFQAITAFTVAHSLTLALATLGVVRVPSKLAEAWIALSILLVAVEVARPAERRGALGRERPWAIAFGFGLLHGLGFAGALREIGLPEGDVPLALVCFNVGVELGQLAFVTACLATLAALAAAAGRLVGASRWNPTPALAWLIGTSAAYWTFDRVAAFWL